MVSRYTFLKNILICHAVTYHRLQGQRHFRQILKSPKSLHPQYPRKLFLWDRWRCLMRDLRPCVTFSSAWRRISEEGLDWLKASCLWEGGGESLREGKTEFGQWCLDFSPLPLLHLLCFSLQKRVSDFMLLTRMWPDSATLALHTKRKRSW